MARAVKAVASCFAIAIARGVGPRGRRWASLSGEALAQVTELRAVEHNIRLLLRSASLGPADVAEAWKRIQALRRPCPGVAVGAHSTALAPWPTRDREVTPARRTPLLRAATRRVPPWRFP